MESEALIAAIVAEPDAVAPFLQYADWLLDHGDPRGELIQLQLIAESGGATDAHRIWIKALLADEDRLLSPRLAEVAHYWSFRFRRGFIRSAALCGGADDPPGIEAVEALVADPHLGLLSWLALTHPAAETVSFWRPVLAAPRPNLRELVVSNLGRGSELLHQLPNLQMLDLIGESPIERLVHPRLRTLRCRPTGLTAYKFRSSTAFSSAVTGAFELPALEEFEWLLGNQDEILTDRRSMFHQPPPRLQRLHLNLHLGVGDVLPELVQCAVVKQLRALRVPGELKGLLELAPMLRHLERLQLVSRGRIERGEMLELRGALERALPTTKLDIAWEEFVEGSAAAREPVDHESRDHDGNIDALGAYVHGRTS